MEKLSQTQRHTFILNKLRKEGELRVIDISNELNVSMVTIRKDLEYLESKKLLYKTHGRICASNPYTQDKHVEEKEFISADEKKSIALKAAELIEPKDAVIFASGTTILQLAQVVEPIDRLTVLTSALNVAMALLKKDNIEVIQLGGIIRKTSTSVTGPFAEHILQQYSGSKLFLGVDGIDLEYGCTTSNILEAHVNQHMIKAAQKTIILTDSSKFGKRGFGKICDFSDVDQIITDSNINPRIARQIEDAGVELTIVTN